MNPGTAISNREVLQKIAADLPKSCEDVDNILCDLERNGIDGLTLTVAVLAWVSVRGRAMAPESALLVQETLRTVNGPLVMSQAHNRNVEARRQTEGVIPLTNEVKRA